MNPSLRGMGELAEIRLATVCRGIIHQRHDGKDEQKVDEDSHALMMSLPDGGILMGGKDARRVVHGARDGSNYGWGRICQSSASVSLPLGAHVLTVSSTPFSAM